MPVARTWVVRGGRDVEANLHRHRLVVDSSEQLVQADAALHVGGIVVTKKYQKLDTDELSSVFYRLHDRSAASGN